MAGLLVVPALMLAACSESPAPTQAEAPLALPAPRLLRSTSTSGVVISQVYGGGGNSGAPLNRDFVELFNAGDAAVSLNGWSVQYASATGTGNFGQTANQLVALPDVALQPGQYYLIQLAGGSNGAPLPTPDLVGTINMAGASGKVALVLQATTLGCNGGSTPCSPEQLALIEDLVGYGAANFFEGSAAAPQLSNALAGFRLDAGCTDTNNNSADFANAEPAPRNTANALNPCAGSPDVTVAEVAPADGAENVALDAVLAVSFTRPVVVQDEWYSLVCSTTGTRTATVSGGPVTFTIDPDDDFAPGESCTATLFAGAVADANDPSIVLTTNFSWTFTTVGGDVCTLPFTPTYDIQGSGLVSPLVGQVVSTRAVVVGDYQGAQPALRGFYIQDAEGDGDPSTSDGLFVFNGNDISVALGDIVRVTGTVQEFQEQTQLSSVSALTVCGSGASVAPTTVTMPFPTATYLERYEGMLVRFPQPLSVTEHFQLGRFGQVVVSSGGRLVQPTSVAAPGGPAQALQAQNDLNRLIVDDELQNQNRDPIVFGRSQMSLTASNTLRGGDVASGMVGVMTYGWAGNAASGNAYRLRPIGALDGGLPMFVATNERPTSPPDVSGSLRVASVNLLNYFNTFSGCTRGVGGANVDCRGASNPAEFERQRNKTLAMLQGLDADIIGVVELENDGYAPESAVADLVNGLNSVMGTTEWAFIDADSGTGEVNSMGSDAIRNALLYRRGRVRPVGTTAVLNSIEFQNAGEPNPGNRPALAQTFQVPNRGSVTVVINHLRSKGGSNCQVPDIGDGQGNCNVMRTIAATTLGNWLNTNPTGIADPRVLIIGDLNAYAQEDPITALRNFGFTNLLEAKLGPSAYTYVFDGQWGYLDHALASDALLPQVTGVASWHVNADEPSVLDYTTSFKSSNQLTTLYAPDAFRSSDHDPVLVGLTLQAGAPPVPERLPGGSRPSVPPFGAPARR